MGTLTVSMGIRCWKNISARFEGLQGCCLSSSADGSPIQFRFSDFIPNSSNTVLKPWNLYWHSYFLMCPYELDTALDFWYFILCWFFEKDTLLWMLMHLLSALWVFSHIWKKSNLVPGINYILFAPEDERYNLRKSIMITVKHKQKAMVLTWSRTFGP